MTSKALLEKLRPISEYTRLFVLYVIIIFFVQTVAMVSRTVLYGLLDTVLDVFHQDSLGGDSAALYSALSTLLTTPVLAEDFFGRVKHHSFSVIVVN